MITRETFRIFRLVREIFTYAELPKEAERRPVDLADVTTRAWAAMENDPRATDIAIQTVIDPNAACVSGDGERLALAFTNIMMNSVDAIAASGASSGQLTVTARRSGRQVVLEFTDDGPGMTEEQLAHALEPFVTTKEPGAGTGLGLWICYQIIHRHGGTIRLRSTLGSGTTVVVELLAADEDS
jgi:signal transduction histidine kinase